MIASTLEYNHVEITEDYISQIESLIPVDFTEDNKNFILDIVKRFALMTGDAFALNVEPFNSYSNEQKRFGIQIIAEWTFNKALELVPSKVKEEHYEEILRKIAFEAFEVIESGYNKNIKISQMLNLIEQKVNKSFEKTCKKLK